MAAGPDTATRLRKAAHDIRTPLATIVQSIDALLELPDERSERARTLFEVLRRNVLWMGQVLDASIARELVGAQDVDLRALISDVRALIGPLLAVRQQTVTIDARGGSMRMRAEYASLARALLNLIENASKYGPAGDEIRVVLRRRASRMLVAVCDHGPGIPVGESRAVFAAFYRTTQARASRHAGRGLGLAVVRDMVESHGGSVGVSRSGGETRVWFSIPLREETADRAG